MAAELMATHTVVAVADLEPGQEWVVGELPPAHHHFLFGELAVRELLALVRDADIVVGGVGWIVPAGFALKTKTFVVLGGHGGHNAPEKITDPRLDLSRIGFAIPERVLPMHEHAARLRQEDRGPARAVFPLGRAGNSLVAQFARRRLTWWPQLGIGYYPVEAGHRALRSGLFRPLRSQCADRSRPRADAGALRFRRAALPGNADRCRHRLGRVHRTAPQSRGARPTATMSIRPALAWLDERMLLVDPYLVPFDAMTLVGRARAHPGLPVAARQCARMAVPVAADLPRCRACAALEAFQAGTNIAGISPATGWCSR